MSDIEMHDESVRRGLKKYRGSISFCLSPEEFTSLDELVFVIATKKPNHGTRGINHDDEPIFNI